jgi:hypothetical protein
MNSAGTHWDYTDNQPYNFGTCGVFIDETAQDDYNYGEFTTSC